MSQKRQCLLIGDGRLARHLQFYLSSSGLDWLQWKRQEGFSKLETLIQNLDSPLVLLAVSDRAIENLARKLPLSWVKFHFSGALFTPLAFGVHPLMTFGFSLYPRKFYDEIPLIVDQAASKLPEIQSLPNPIRALDSQNKPLYHSLCHLAGNYPKWIWAEVFRTLEDKLDVPREFFKVFLEESLKQSLNQQADLQTGPFGRADLETIQGHLASLQPFPILKKSYDSFYESFQEDIKNELT